MLAFAYFCLNTAEAVDLGTKNGYKETKYEIRLNTAEAVDLGTTL